MHMTSREATPLSALLHCLLNMCCHISALPYKGYLAFLCDRVIQPTFRERKGTAC